MNQTILRKYFSRQSSVFHSTLHKYYSLAVETLGKYRYKSHKPLYSETTGNYDYFCIWYDGHASYMYHCYYMYIIAFQWFCQKKKKYKKNTEVLMHAVYEMQLLWTFSNVLFVNYNALRFLTKGCHKCQLPEILKVEIVFQL
jgi:hypothetical protein